jgi:DNA polymerase III delta prime subunit
MSNNSTVSELGRLVGLAGAKKAVSALIEGKFNAHAILFYGGEGCGKETLAQILSEFWLCTQPTELGADGACRACLSVAKGTNADLLMIRPQGAGNLIGIKQLQRRPDSEQTTLSMQEFLRTPPLLSKHKIVRIVDAERMTGSSANSLLKTLEEPPNFAKLILSTTSTSAILPTILSRVVAIACSLPSDLELREIFPSATDEDLLLAERAPGRIAEILKHQDLYRDLVVFANMLPGRKKHEALKVSESLRAISDRFNTKMGAGARLANAEIARSLALIFTRAPGYPLAWGEYFVEAYERILANGNATLIFDSLFATILHP